MVNYHGEQLSTLTWPRYPCGARFVTWARGAPMVAETKLQGGSWQAFMADKFPHALDDEIKKVHQEFFMAA
eukprot:12891570-Prorocentrum_lima.AAC.1